MSNASANRETVSVCIPTYNQAAYLAGAIRSVLAQEHPVDEIIIADDASTDKTAAICQQFARENPVIHYHRHERNLGIQANADFIFRKATSTYVVRLDSDDELLPGYVSRLLAAIQNSPEAAYAHGDVWEVDQEGKRTRLRTLYRKSGFQPARDALVACLSGYRVAANILFFRRSALERVDYMKDRGDFAEDYHLSIALARIGYGNVYVAEPLAQYRVWVDAQGIRAKRKERELIGLIRVFTSQIEPGFTEAGLSLESVRKSRRTFARRHVVALDNPGYTAEEKSRLEAYLIELGDSMSLRLLMRLSYWHLGFIWRGWWWLVDFVRQATKKTRRFLRKS